MKIVIDARFWGPGHTGLGVYTRELVKSLSKIDNKNEYTLLVREKLTDAPQKMKQIVVDARAYTLKEQLLVAKTLYRLSPDLVHFPSINIPILYFGKFVVTIHDLIKHNSRGPATSTHDPFVYWPKYIIYHFVTAWAVWRSQKILVPSNVVKQKLTSFYHVPSEKIIVTYEAAVLPTDNETEIVLPKKFALYAGNAYPHKNLDRLVKIWEKIHRATQVKLAIVSGRNIFWERIQKLSGENVIHLGHLDDQQLTFVHRKAQLYVFPSLDEGFGIPALDAMNVGVPIACSDLPVFREVYDDAAHYFNPCDEVDMANKIIEALTDSNLRKKLIKNGKNQVAKYSWIKTAEQTFVTYESCSRL